MELPSPSTAAENRLALRLVVRDPESVAELTRLEEGGEREEHALRALRIGLLALRQAAGVIDADAVRQEGRDILNRLQLQLGSHQAWMRDQVAQVLDKYFDPSSGQFPQRVKRLVEKDGELERVLREQIAGGDSPLRRTLAEHVGPESRLMRLLNPTDSEGLVKSLEGVLDESLATQRERILEQFSLDTEGSALQRLVKELGQNHADISEALQKRVGEVVREFSLDDDQSALSKLVRRVDAAQQKISAEFSLDQESSALARMRREMLEVLDKSARSDANFREEVMKALGELQGRREEAAHGTRHGLEFEDELVRLLRERAQAAGDLVEATGMKTGIIPNSKVGDAVWELGPEHAAAGARIVIEAKEKQGVSLSDARAEIETARKNRRADVGLFVFSHKTAPEGLSPFQRLGSDVFLVWDATDPDSDVWLEAGTETARALCTRASGERAAKAADFEKIDRAILAMEKLGDQLEEITTASNTIDSANERIRERVRISRKQIGRQVDRLREAVTDLKDA